MSFLTDLFEGNFSNLGTDIVDAPSSLINHPDELLETGAAALAVAAPFAFPEIAAGFGAADLGLGAADLGAADATFGAFDAGTFGANTADVAAGIGTAESAATGLTAADLGLADAAIGASFDPEAFAAESGTIASDLGPSNTLLGSIGGSFDDAALPEGSTLATGNLDLGTGLDPNTGEAPGFDTYGNAPAPAADTGARSLLPSGPGGVDTQPANLSAANKEFGTFDPGGFASNTANAGTGGFFSNIANSLGLGGVSTGDMLKLGAGLAPLALTLGMGEPKLPAGAQQSQAAAMQLSQQGMQDLQNARNGQLNQGQLATLAQNRNDLENKWRQTLYNQGVTDVSKDERWPQISAQIDRDITAQTATMIQQNITNALQETGQAATTLNAVAQMQLTSDQQFTNNLIGATKALGFAAGTGAFKVVAA